MNILITGAGRGLGYELTSEALERGHGVVAGVRSPKETNEKLSALAEKYGERLSIVELDVTNEEGIAALASQLKEQGVSLGAIINNAAILNSRNTQIEQLDFSDVALTMDINVYGPMRVVKHFLPLLTEKDAAIFNISSEAGSITHAYPGDYPYGISKTALNMFTQQLHVYLQKRGIQVLSIHPGWMRTDMGGGEAPLDASHSARGIIGLLEQRRTPDSHFMFVDHEGNPMPI
ncbi:SDR family oxidoreductase [Paenibacillus algorifonticola]|uniref:SDR family oxidoreductase n=1 Tax=Paenibacillus algorifonticola TaxID=684063 RepID=UPI003D288B9B